MPHVMQKVLLQCALLQGCCSVSRAAMKFDVGI